MKYEQLKCKLNIKFVVSASKYTTSSQRQHCTGDSFDDILSCCPNGSLP